MKLVTVTLKAPVVDNHAEVWSFTVPKRDAKPAELFDQPGVNVIRVYVEASGRLFLIPVDNVAGLTHYEDDRPEPAPRERRNSEA